MDWSPRVSLPNEERAADTFDVIQDSGPTVWGSEFAACLWICAGKGADMEKGATMPLFGMTGSKILHHEEEEEKEEEEEEEEEEERDENAEDNVLWCTCQG